MFNTQQQTLSKLTRVAAFVFYLFLIIFLFFYIKNIDFSAIGSLHFTWPFILIASLFGIAMRYWQIFGWLTILKDLGANSLKGSRIELAYVYAKSWLGRYIPGMAPWILGKIYFASKHGVSKSKLAVGSLIESVLQIAVILGLSSLMFLLDERFNVIDPKLRILMSVVLVVCFVLIMPPIFNKLVAFIYKLVRKKPFPAEHKMPAKTLFKGIAIYSIGGILYGLFLFFLTKGVYPELGYDNMLFVIGSGSLAGALGIIAVFAPSGLGVRDGIQLILFSLTMPPELALTVTVLTRLSDVTLDLTFFVIAWINKILTNRAA